MHPQTHRHSVVFMLPLFLSFPHTTFAFFTRGSHIFNLTPLYPPTTLTSFAIIFFIAFHFCTSCIFLSIPLAFLSVGAKLIRPEKDILRYVLSYPPYGCPLFTCIILQINNRRRSATMMLPWFSRTIVIKKTKNWLAGFDTFMS